MKTLVSFLLTFQLAQAAVVYTEQNWSTTTNQLEAYFSPRETFTPEFRMVLGASPFITNTPNTLSIGYIDTYTYYGSAIIHYYGEVWNMHSFGLPTSSKLNLLWKPGVEGYLGLAIKPEGTRDINNAWYHIRWNENDTITFIDSAYETTPFTEIVIGQVPEPSCVILLLTSFVMMFKRNRH